MSRRNAADIVIADEATPCASCGKMTRMSKLDAKPRAGHFTVDQLARAADAGAELKRLECDYCYGPGYNVQ